MEKASCQVCGALAVWQYQPLDGIGEYCDDHVPRGCSCNIIDMGNPRARKQHTDEQGRLLPCCELWFDKNGWEPTNREEVEAYKEASKAMRTLAQAEKA